MKLQSFRPMLWVDDVKATIDYYVDTLGFTADNHLDNWEWGCAVRDGVEFMFCKPFRGFDYSGPKFTGSIYFNTEDVDDWWQLLKDKADILYPIEDFDYKMREFAIRDCNGYILQFGRSIG